jgi:hypothetical protein
MSPFCAACGYLGLPLALGAFLAWLLSRPLPPERARRTFIRYWLLTTGTFLLLALAPVIASLVTR